VAARLPFLLMYHNPCSYTVAIIQSWGWLLFIKEIQLSVSNLAADPRFKGSDLEAWNSQVSSQLGMLMFQLNK